MRKRISETGYNKKIFLFLVILTIVSVAVALIKASGLASVDTIFPDEQTTKVTTITAEDWADTDMYPGGVFYKIPQNASGAQVLEITINWDSIDVYLEDELLYSFDDEYHELGRASHWINIPEGSNGKRIILTSNAGSASLTSVLQSGCYLGTADAICHHFFMKNLPTLLLVVIDVMMAMIVILILAVLRRKLPRVLICGIWDLFFFITLNCIWLISDCGLLELFTLRTGLWALISYVVFMLMPVFMLRFNQRFLTHHKEIFRILIMSTLGLTLATLFLYIARVAPLSTLLPFHQVLMASGYIITFFLCDREIRDYHIKRLTPIRNGISLVSIFMILTILLYWQGQNALYPLAYDAGITCYIVCLMVLVVKQAYYNIEKKVEMDTYRKLAYMDVMTKIYNRAAFIKHNKEGADVRECAYVMFDINNLKLVNDSMGHQVGDDLIMRAATCIRDTFEKAGKCYRLGGDEFMVVLKNIHDENELYSYLEVFENQVWSSNEQLAEDQAPLSIAYGYSLAGTEPRSDAEMYAEADEMMYSRKRQMKEDYFKTDTA